MTSRVPQLLVTLTPDGHLAVELPGHQGTRRQIVLRQGEAGASLTRILEAQARESAEIGLDGAPTVAQVRHWERHTIWADSRCRFCLAEGRAKPDHQRAAPKKTLVHKTLSGVEVRRIRAGTKGTAVCKVNLKDLGL